MSTEELTGFSNSYADTVRCDLEDTRRYTIRGFHTGINTLRGFDIEPLLFFRLHVNSTQLRYPYIIVENI